MTVTNEIVKTNTGFMSPSNMNEAFKFAEIAAKSDLVPKDYRNKPGNIIIAMTMGQELGLQPIQAIQNIAVINGRPSLWGDAMIALIRGHHTCEYIKEEIDRENKVAICRAKRKGQDEEVREFSLEDAKTAGLSGKQGPWRNYPLRMLQQRARSWALRDVWPDVLTGLVSAEEAMDTPQDYDKPASATGTLKDKLAAKAGEAEEVEEAQVVEKSEAPPEEPTCLDIDDCLAKIQTIDNIPHLENWYRKNSAWFADNMSEDGLNKIIDACAKKRAEIKKSLSDAPKFINDCPDGKGKIPVDYCNDECGKREGCPAL